LLGEAQKIDPKARPPRVIGADLLADWCSRYPGIVKRLRPFLSAMHDFRTWGRVETAQAETFVAIDSRQAATSAIGQFADLAQPTCQPVLTISGEAGVGKTRCVLEALRTVPGIEALVVTSDVVTSDDERAAADLIRQLVSELRFRAIFVVDGMGTATRATVARLLTADAGRLRVIAIDNNRQDDPAPEGEIRLGPLQRQDVERILAANFPAIPNEQRWAIAELAAGCVRLAVDICRNIHLVSPRGELAPLIPLIRDQYLAVRLTEEQRRVVELVSLLARVAYCGPLAHQLLALCAACPAAQLTAEEVVAIAGDIRSVPGFIAVGSRYLYVTPPVIAQAAFRAAWQRWVRPDPERFFAGLTPELEDALSRQLRDAGTDEMRRLFTCRHESGLRGPGTDAMSDPGTMGRLLQLVEVEPETTFPPLCRLIESATPGQIAGLDQLPAGRQSPGGRWTARRELVWRAEWLLRFPEFYLFAERILFRLAMAETESYGNNATAIWCQSYRPYFSGTPIPFAGRLAQLDKRLNAATDEAQMRLCLEALEGPLTVDGPAYRGGSPSLVSGRMTPPDWFPTTHEEARAVWQSTVEMVTRNARSPNAAIADGVIDVTVRHAFGLIHNGHLNDLIGVIESRPIGGARLVEVLHFIDQFLALYCNPDRHNVPAEIEVELQVWRQRLLPTSLLERLQTTVRRTYYDIYLYNPDHGESLVSGLARELVSDSATLAAALPWLFTEEARSSHALGMALGRLDGTAALLDLLADEARGQPNTALLRGYIVGLLERYHAQARRVCQLLNRLTPAQPYLVFDLLTTSLPILCPIDRAFTLVDSGQIPATCLGEVWHLTGDRPLTGDELSGILTRLLPRLQGGDAGAGRAAIDVLSIHLHAARRTLPEAVAFNAQQLPLVRAFLEGTLAIDLDREGWAWDEVLAELARSEPASAIRLAVCALASENHRSLPNRTERFLAGLAPQHPQTVMDELGAGLLDPATGWRVRLRELKPVIATLPIQVIRAWVEQYALAGARVLARLLPSPYLQEGVPTVAELTEFVLDRFGEDDRVFQEFCAGSGSPGSRWGDIGREYEQEAHAARQFFTHQCRWIQAWARRAEGSARSFADWCRADNEEFEAP